MKEKFDLLLNNYLKDETEVVDSSQDYYVQFVKNTPDDLYKYFDKKKYLIKASVGVGQKCEIPWLCIFNRDITVSATQGIYICYLFKSDMSGFYLVLGQGITTFSELYGISKYENINKVAEYFRNLISNNSFSREPIELKGVKGLAKGYEAGTIISKYYSKNNYSETELLTDLLHLKKIYEQICETISESSYMEIVDNVIKNIEPVYMIQKEANKLIKEILKKEDNVTSIDIAFLEEVGIPKYKKKNKYAQIAKKITRKIDYIKKAKSNAQNGLLGENLVINYEKERLIKLGRADLAEDIKWISKQDDGTGYDIISFDVGKSNDVQERYIEVKSTESGDTNDFYISSNEIKTMEKLKNQYFLYRVYKVKTKHPKVFILGYEDFKNKIELTVENYVARIKEEEV